MSIFHHLLLSMSHRFFFLFSRSEWVNCVVYLDIFHIFLLIFFRLMRKTKNTRVLTKRNRPFVRWQRKDSIKLDKISTFHLELILFRKIVGGRRRKIEKSVLGFAWQFASTISLFFPFTFVAWKGKFLRFSYKLDLNQFSYFWRQRIFFHLFVLSIQSLSLNSSCDGKRLIDELCWGNLRFSSTPVANFSSDLFYG